MGPEDRIRRFCDAINDNDADAAVATNPVGTLGGVLSKAAKVVADAPLESADSLLAASYAVTWYVNIVLATRPVSWYVVVVVVVPTAVPLR